ncbi:MULTISPECIES: alpha/beta fold hydrolase [Cyanophyceae]|jgi:pimeloyl-ACP methyl ester carboxylesterase|uniref:alpha/beta fold hydrolase n=1 Tax=Cyanophyceae TaxID=3028117 RepID=UPI0016825F79|nr:alpha/beta hydrolase [Trichocoleus sp. FACHB-40]MBD2003330.1 alpha/beta hydrolase [Trichocoleus sp. FACHB-40]
MLQFQPLGFEQKVIETSLGSMVYYSALDQPWSLPRQGADLPPLIFLHGFGGGSSAYEWSKVYPAFATTYRVLAPDLIGWGQSAHPVRDYQVADYLKTLTEFLEKISISTGEQGFAPLQVVASSLTAAITIRLAIQRPDLFKTLFLVCPSGFADFGQDAGRRLPLQVIGTPILDKLIYTLGATNEVSVRNFLERFLFAKPERVSQDMVEAFLASAQQPNAEYAALAFLRGDLYFDLSLYIQQLTVPTYVLWGEEAQFTKLRLGRRLAGLNKQAISVFQPVPGTGVLPHLEQPELVIGLLQHYLSATNG